MRIITTKPGQKRLYSCVSKAPKWAKSVVNRRRTTQFTLRTTVLGSGADAVRENIGENRQTRPNTKLLGKYRFRRS